MIEHTNKPESEVFVIPSIRVEQHRRPALYEHLHQVGHIEQFVVEALERDLVAERWDPNLVLTTILQQVQALQPESSQGCVLATILDEVRAIRQHLEGEGTPSQELPPSISDALANLGKGT